VRAPFCESAGHEYAFCGTACGGHAYGENPPVPCRAASSSGPRHPFPRPSLFPLAGFLFLPSAGRTTDRQPRSCSVHLTASALHLLGRAGTRFCRPSAWRAPPTCQAPERGPKSVSGSWPPVCYARQGAGSGVRGVTYWVLGLVMPSTVLTLVDAVAPTNLFWTCGRSGGGTLFPCRVSPGPEGCKREEIEMELTGQTLGLGADACWEARTHGVVSWSYSLMSRLFSARSRARSGVT
jgi:hypothetical protein